MPSAGELDMHDLMIDNLRMETDAISELDMHDLMIDNLHMETDAISG